MVETCPAVDGDAHLGPDAAQQSLELARADRRHDRRERPLLSGRPPAAARSPASGWAPGSPPRTRAHPQLVEGAGEPLDMLSVSPVGQPDDARTGFLRDDGDHIRCLIPPPPQVVERALRPPRAGLPEPHDVRTGRAQRRRHAEVGARGCVNPVLSRHDPKIVDQECATEGAKRGGKLQEMRNQAIRHERRRATTGSNASRNGSCTVT